MIFIKETSVLLVVLIHTSRPDRIKQEDKPDVKEQRVKRDGAYSFNMGMQMGSNNPRHHKKDEQHVGKDQDEQKQYGHKIKGSGNLELNKNEHHDLEIEKIPDTERLIDASINVDTKQKMPAQSYETKIKARDAAAEGGQVKKMQSDDDDEQGDSRLKSMSDEMQKEGSMRRMIGTVQKAVSIMGPEFFARILDHMNVLVQRDRQMAEVVSLFKEYLHTMAENIPAKLFMVGEALKKRLTLDVKKKFGMEVLTVIGSLPEYEKENFNKVIKMLRDEGESTPYSPKAGHQPGVHPLSPDGLQDMFTMFTSQTGRSAFFDSMSVIFNKFKAEDIVNWLIRSKTWDTISDMTAVDLIHISKSFFQELTLEGISKMIDVRVLLDQALDEEGKRKLNFIAKTLDKLMDPDIKEKFEMVKKEKKMRRAKENQAKEPKSEFKFIVPDNDYSSSKNKNKNIEDDDESSQRDPSQRDDGLARQRRGSYEMNLEKMRRVLHYRYPHAKERAREMEETFKQRFRSRRSDNEPGKFFKASEREIERLRKDRKGGMDPLPVYKSKPYGDLVKGISGGMDSKMLQNNKDRIERYLRSNVKEKEEENDDNVKENKRQKRDVQHNSDAKLNKNDDKRAYKSAIAKSIEAAVRAITKNKDKDGGNSAEEFDNDKKKVKHKRESEINVPEPKVKSNKERVENDNDNDDTKNDDDERRERRDLRQLLRNGPIFLARHPDEEEKEEKLARQKRGDRKEKEVAPLDKNSDRKDQKHDKRSVSDAEVNEAIKKVNYIQQEINGERRRREQEAKDLKLKEKAKIEKSEESKRVEREAVKDRDDGMVKFFVHPPRNNKKQN